MRRREDGEAPDIIFYFLIDLINAKAKVNSLKLYLYFNTAIKFMRDLRPIILFISQRFHRIGQGRFQRLPGNG